MTVPIGSGNISKVRLAEQGSDPATPPSGFAYAYAKTDGGLYLKNDGGNVLGPFGTSLDLVTGTSTVLDGATTLVIGSGLSLSVTGTTAFVNGGGSDVAWTDFGSISTIVGWAATPTKNIWYKVVGNIVHVSVHITGTSDATGVSFTLPFVAKNSTNYKTRFGIQIQDNGVVSATGGMGALEPNSNVVNVYITWAANSWTALGTKLIQGQFWYEKA